MSKQDNNRELHYLQWFYQNADFGPAESDVRARMNDRYIAEGNTLPERYDFCCQCGEATKECVCEVGK